MNPQSHKTLTEAEDWTFRTADTNALTHGIHPYPAKMIPQIAHRLIEKYGNPNTVLFDPYCGSGTTLLEGMLAGAIAIGTDLNPLARLIARVKTTPLDIAELDKEIRQFPTEAPNRAIQIPDIPNIDYWFSQSSQRDLAAIRQHIENLSGNNIADVFRVAFSSTVRKSSWTRNSEFKLYRVSPRQMNSHNAKPFEMMKHSLSDLRNSLHSLNAVLTDKISIPKVYGFNSVTELPADVISPGSIDLVVTSPPYGDSRTTVAYGQFSRLSSQWLGYAEAGKVDSLLMGGNVIANQTFFGIDVLDTAISCIASLDKKRAREVASFFEDYRSSIRNVAREMKVGSHACYVVGNRTVKGYKVPTVQTTALFFEENGFETIDICTRDIPNKRMPSANSPSNIRGRVGQTINTEQIVICKKTRNIATI